MSYTDLHKHFPFFNKTLVETINQECDIITVPNHQEILRKGQYVKVIPVVLKGLLRVYTTHDNKELLLYHIKASESCVMSFAAGIKNGTSEIYAQTLQDTEILLLPADRLKKWLQQFPELNLLFNSQYEMRYADLLNTIENMVFHKMDERILNLLHDKAVLTNSQIIKISHQALADDLATSREVISRVLKKLENDNKLGLSHQTIKIL
ncbi:Crp/Fnr family transcriptional regulator [Nonlabens mediterrranea]|uniref:Crp/Fnr family transcriptional regulator n=1 Tax=Nonlabens mediterrranea TaxID=1419947 RepID=A0ABS0A756_9FLAO|nr:Crp/Fnr family transcriptional regulator [Nonlabens mediterrranea]